MAYKNQSNLKGPVDRAIRIAVRPYEKTPEAQDLKRRSVESHSSQIPVRFYEGRRDFSANYNQPRIGRHYSKKGHLNNSGFFYSNDCSSYYSRGNGREDYVIGQISEMPTADDAPEGINVRRGIKNKKGWLNERFHARTLPYELIEAELKRAFKEDLLNLYGPDVDWQYLICDASEPNIELENMGQILDQLKAQEIGRANQLSRLYNFILKNKHPCKMPMGDLTIGLNEPYAKSIESNGYESHEGYSQKKDGEDEIHMKVLDFDAWARFYRASNTYQKEEAVLEHALADEKGGSPQGNGTHPELLTMLY